MQKASQMQPLLASHFFAKYRNEIFSIFGQPMNNVPCLAQIRC